jgi:hypothetical protein
MQNKGPHCEQGTNPTGGRAMTLDLSPCPTAGAGVHLWIMQAAWECKGLGLTAQQAADLIADKMTRKPSPGNEIESAVAKAYGSTPQRHRLPAGKVFVRAVKPTYQPSKLESLARKMDGFGPEELEKKSPIRPKSRTVASFLFHLFEPGEQVLLFDKFASQGCAIADRPGPLEIFDSHCLDFMQKPKRGEGSWFLANPIDGQWRELERLKSEHNPTGRSRRAEECVTAFRYLVLESDQAPPDLWLAALVQLPLPIVSIVTSGGKSIHALIRLDAESGEHWRELKSKIERPLVWLGADPGAMTAVRLTRLPCCYRAEKKQWQELLFLNPNPTATPICELPDL